MRSPVSAGVVFATRIDADLLREAKALAALRDEAVAQVIRRALRQYVASGLRASARAGVAAAGGGSVSPLRA
jgi:predicted transcriptional regulator